MSFLRGNLLRTALICAALLVGVSVGYGQDGEVSFKVYNRTDTKITRLLVAEPGQKKWSYFDIGSGIAPGKSATLVWDKSAYEEDCVQWFKAVYADKSSSEPVKVDFCEDELELEFND